LFFAPVYMVLQQLKLLSGIEFIHKRFCESAGYNDGYNMMTLEGCFRIQTFVELFFHTVPLIVIESFSNEATEWTSIAKLTMIVMIVMIVKNMCLVTMFAIRKLIDNSRDAAMRPQTDASPLT